MSAPFHAHLAPYLFSALLVFLVFRRIRRNFGLQPWRPVRIGIRLTLLGLVALLLASAAIFVPQLRMAVIAGFVTGLPLGLFGLMHTRLEWNNGQRWYTPNPWIGLALTALLVGRLGWRIFHADLLTAQSAPQASALTLGLAALLIGYSLAYTVGLILRMRRLADAHPSAAANGAVAFTTSAAPSPPAPPAPLD
ncbi:hypothetical protein [Pseudoxanthomonas kalamensis]|uniref:hypothetical protein n=1 Tax=Pseudoxanthomonas kalamensis TaxID=289483 RepID=UPI001B873F31|nr:hypothetical protein [Pseudoxanthomonas kalamensis]